MPRISRAIAVGYPHHITQRGNYRQTVFKEAEEYARYLELLTQYSRRHELEIWAYCLMPNHVHIVGVPRAEDSLSSVFRTVHMLYSTYCNRKADAVGHLWQGRYYSCALDERHVYAAVRYVELNPVRAELVANAQDYPWSSAKSHASGIADRVLSGRCFLEETIPNWKEYLFEPRDTEAQTSLIKSTRTGRPCGENDFVTQLENLLGRRFATLPSGRPHAGKHQEADAEKE
ncbi:MAG: transposase [Syntrophobacterales bacterium]|nr:MAG: transposase [Syntrophobacterales bacterium]